MRIICCAALGNRERIGAARIQPTVTRIGSSRRAAPVTGTAGVQPNGHRDRFPWEVPAMIAPKKAGRLPRDGEALAAFAEHLG